MARTESQELFDEAFGSPEDRKEHGGRPQTDPSLEFVDPRDAELDYWRFGGIFFYPMLIRLGKGWMIALEVAVLVAIGGSAALGLPLLGVAMVLALLLLSVYQLVSIHGWTDAYNARVAARRADVIKRRDD